MVEKARTAKTIEESFEFAESFWRVMNIDEFFRENVFLIYLKEDSTKKDVQYVFEETLKRYADKDHTDEYGIDYGFDVAKAFMQSYAMRSLKHLSFDQCIDLLVRLDSYRIRGLSKELAATIMCGNDELIEKSLNDYLSIDIIKPKSLEELSGNIKIIKRAMYFYGGMHGLDRYADIVFNYIDELAVFSLENTEYQDPVLELHEEFAKWFKGVEYTDRAKRKYEEYKIKIKK